MNAGEKRGSTAHHHDQHHHDQHHHDQHHRHDHSGAELTVVALGTEIHLKDETSPAGVRAAVSDFCAALAEKLASRGCRAIGHVKGVLDADSGGALYFSLTTFDTPAELRGGFTRSVMACRLTVNVIVFHVDEAAVESCVDEAIERCLGRRSDSIGSR